MKSKAVFISFAVLLILCFPGISKADAVLSVDGPASVTKGSTFTVNVAIAGVADLYGYEFDLGFDPTVLQAKSVTEGPFLPSGGSTIFFDGGIDNFFGIIPFNVGSLIGGSSGVSGAGELVSFQFLALANGTSGINISNELLSDSNLNILSDSVKNGSVTVVPHSVKTPEPSTNLLVLLALLVFGGMMQAKKLRLHSEA